jgi:tRNA 2-thiouridine synthesizing protein A
VNAAARVDVRAYACPITWVKTRLAFDRLSEGDVLEVWLREGEPLASVPRSAEEDGHRVVGVEPLAGETPGSYRVLLMKGTRSASPALP